MPIRAVLDSCVLYPLPLRDTLLRVAEIGLLEPRWSDRILEEVERNLVSDDRATPEQFARLRDAMNDAFDGALVAAEAIVDIEPSMKNEAHDRHVLAAAVVADAEMVVTTNIRHFPSSACDPHAIDVVHPDELLTDFAELHPGLIRAALVRQAEKLRKPPMDVERILKLLSPAVPRFVEAIGDIGRQKP